MLAKAAELVQPLRVARAANELGNELGFEWPAHLFRGRHQMNDEPLLTLHCPKCVQIVEVVTENANLVCLDCGHKFDDAIAAKYLIPVLQTEVVMPTSPAR